MRRPTSHELFDAREEGKGKGSAYGATARPEATATFTPVDVDAPVVTRARPEAVVAARSLDRKLEL